MSISQFYPDLHADRVCTHKFEFVTARTISFGVNVPISVITPFALNEFKIPIK